MTDGDPLVVQALGSTVRIEFHPTVAHLEERVRHAWAGCAVNANLAATVQRLTLSSGPERIPGTLWMANDEPLLERLSQHLTLRGIHALAGERLMLHAAGLAHPETGATAVLVGPSGMGKSTLVRTLGPRWIYVTDETVALDRELNVLPYPKPVLLRRRDNQFKHAVAPADLGLELTARPFRAAAFILLSRDSETTGLNVESVPTVPALAELAPHTSHLAQIRQPLQQLAAVLHATGGLQVAQYAEAKDLAPLLEGVLSRV